MTNDLVNAVRASIVEVGLSKTLEQVAQVVEDEGMAILKICSALKHAAPTNGSGDLPPSNHKFGKRGAELMELIQGAKSAQAVGQWRRVLRKTQGIPGAVKNEIYAASEARLEVLRRKP